MEFCVTKSGGYLIPPSDTTPCNHVLDLSFIDKLPVLRCNARTLHVFKHGPDAAKSIRMALSKALVPYYPLAGRLKNSSENELQIACSGEGIWFVEAFSDRRLDDFDYFDDAITIPYDKLLPDSPPESDGLDPLVLVQVTQFASDGFVIGLVFCHSICDGLGAAQFLKAVGELAKGDVDQLSVAPVWCRDFIESPEQQVSHPIPFPNMPPPMPDYQLEHAKFDISFDQIMKLKRTFQESTGKTCSSFEIVAAHLWRSRTSAINFEKETEVKLVFFANCRQLLKQPLPKGFYGNCFFPVTITTSSENLTNATNTQVVELIQEAKTKLPDEFNRWINGDLMKEGIDPFAPPLVYTTLFISEWGRLGFNEVDYGWGPPIHVVPIQGSSIIPVGIVSSVPSPEKGIRLMTWCMEKHHLQLLVEKITTLT